MEFFGLFFDSIISLFSDFINPKKRVFIGYLLLSIGLAFVWLMLARKLSSHSASRKIFDLNIFWSASAKADYKIFILNRAFTFFLSPLLLSQIAIATSLYFALHSQSYIHQGQFSDVHKAAIVGLFSVTMFLVDDFSKYILHRWMHKIPALWAIHKVHHSAETLTPITVYRVHPLEGVLYASRSALAQGSVMACFIFLFGNQVDLYTVVGVNVLVFFFHITGSNLRHSHISIRYWPWLEHILISPAQHQVHHSIAKEHYDKNFGVALAVWDWCFGSLHLSEKNSDLKFGLLQEENSSSSDLITLYIKPVLEVFNIAKKYFIDFFHYAFLKLNLKKE